MVLFFFFNDTATTEIYTLSLHDALPIYILGNDLPEPLLFSFIYDTAPPVLVSTEPSDGETVPVIDDVSVVLTDEFNAGGSVLPSVAGIDLDACTFELIGPDGALVDGELRKEEPGTLSFSPSLANGALADGTYTIRITTVDLVGNASQPILVDFTLIARAPVVLSTTPADDAQFNESIGSVSAALMDNSGTGLDLEGSMVTLIAPNGEAVPGTHSSNDLGVVVLALEDLLATDGSDDGVYALDILAVDNSGVSASHRTTFTYDTTPPAVEVTSPVDGDILKEGISVVSARLTDIGSGVSLAGSSISLSGPANITGVQTNDGVDTIKYEFASLSDRLDANRS